MKLQDTPPPSDPEPVSPSSTLLDPYGDREPDEFVSVWEGPAFEGEVLVRRLEAASIPCDTGEAAEPGRLRLQVPMSYVAEARGLLGEMPEMTADDFALTGDGMPGPDGWPPWVRATVMILVVAIVVLMIWTSI